MLFGTEISKFVMRLGRRCDQDEREIDGGDENCEMYSSSMEVQNPQTWIGLNTSHKGCKKRFQCCKIRAIQGHTGGKLTALELLGHVALPYNRKEFILHKGCSFDCISILKPRLVAGGRSIRNGRQTVFCTPLNPLLEDDPEEEWPSERSHETKKRTLSKRVDTFSGRCLLG